MPAIRTLRQRILALVVVVFAACGGSGVDTSGPMPTASISIPTTVPVNAVLTLAGIGSNSAGGGALTYNWTLTSKPTGSAATISDVTAAQPTLTPDVVGTYAFTFTVNNGTKTNMVSGSTAAIVATPPTIVTDIVAPLSGSVQLSLSSTAGLSAVVWTIDGTALGSGLPLTWDTTTVTNGSHVVGAHIVFSGNYAIDVSTTVQVTQNAVSFSNAAISAASGQLTAIVTAASANGITIVSATLDGAAIGSLAVPNACTDATGVACASTGLNGYSFSGAVVAGAHVVVITATDGIGNRLAIQLLLTST